MSQQHLPDSTSEAVQQLVAVLKYLNPPQQEYKALALSAKAFLEKSASSDRAVERALATYFERFSHGYLLWQGSYEYPKIHEYFQAAYLNAVKAGRGNLEPAFIETLQQLTQAIIEYTWCENALICNNPQGLLEFSERALRCAEAGLQSLSTTSLDPSLRQPLNQYLRINMHLFQGLRFCAQSYLYVQSHQGTPAIQKEEVDNSLEYLNANSQELASELRSYLSFARRYTHLYADHQPTLRVKQSDIFFRAIGYIGQELVNTIFSTDEAGLETLLQNARQATKLPIESVTTDELMDIFETVLGEKFLKHFIFDLLEEGTELSVSVYDGSTKLTYSFKTFEVRFTPLGTISVEFSLHVEDVSISHLRVLESLIAPHSGRFQYTWDMTPNNTLFPEGASFGLLMDIAQYVLDRFCEFLGAETESSNDIRRNFFFDPNMGWQAILSCSRLSLLNHDGTETEPQTEADYHQILNQIEFKGLMIQSREARAGIDDWLFVPKPQDRNLATIRSHETDAVYVGENRALLYLPDEPQFLVAQYIETARLLSDIRLLVIAFNDFVRERINHLEEFLGNIQIKNDKQTSLSSVRDELLEHRAQIESFRLQAEKTLDIVRACAISRYQDHSDLLRAMIRETGIDLSRASLERNTENLDEIQEYLTELLRRKIDERLQFGQSLITWMLIILSVLSALSAIPSIYPIFLDPEQQKNQLLLYMRLSLILIPLAAAVIGIFVWRRNKNT